MDEKPERLSDDDFAYHEKVIANMRYAQGIMEKATTIADSWWTHLRDRYNLVESDVVTPEGIIQRVPHDLPPEPAPIRSVNEPVDETLPEGVVRNFKPEGED